MEEVNKVVQKLIDKKYRISFAESCTGGLCCASLVGVADASQVLDVSFTTYANEAKIKFLKVSAETIGEYGVVSEQVAREMCIGAANAAGSNVAVGVTGIAGPGGATDKKPVGMVCFGFYVNGDVSVYTKQFGALGRNNVRNAAVNFVFKTLNKLLQ